MIDKASGLAGRKIPRRSIVVVVVDLETHVDEFGHQQLDS